MSAEATTIAASAATAPSASSVDQHTTNPSIGSNPSSETNANATAQSSSPKRPCLSPLQSSPSTVTPIDQINPEIRQLIEQAIAELFTITTPRDFQIEAINHCLFGNSVLYINAKCADGKSLCPLTLAGMLRGVTLVLVPLVGLGSDQVSKAENPNHNFEAYHIDEHRGAHAKKLKQRLLSYTADEASHKIIMAYINPQSFKGDPNNPNAGWFGTFSLLASRGLISLICIDKAHYVEQAGRNFHPEFIDAINNIKLIRDKMPTPCPIIAMSATFRRKDQDRITKLLKLATPPAVMAGSLARRDVDWSLIVSGDPASSIKKLFEGNLVTNPTKQVLLYSNSATNAEGPLLDASTKILEAHSKRTKQPMTYCDSIAGGMA